MRFINLSLTVAIIILAAFSNNVSAQDETIRVETNLVTLNVAVTDKNGNFVKNLRKEDFAVFDNRVRQEIDTFSAAEAPVYLGIVYDMHPTTDEHSLNILEALRRFTKELKAKDDFFVTVFNEKGSLTTDFVPTGEQIQKFLSDAAPTTPNSLYDAIFAASEKARARKDAKQILLVLTDGEDHASHHSLKELRLHLRSVNLPIYTVAFHDENRRQWGYTDLYRNGGRQTLEAAETGELDRAALSEISRTSGGQTFERQIQNRFYLHGIFRKVLAEVENQYVIGFYADNPDGKWHKLKISVNPASGTKYKLSGRKGYQSPTRNAAQRSRNYTELN